MAQRHIASGRKGGQAVFARYGSEWMRWIGARGAMVMHSRYELRPHGQNDFLIVNRATGEAVNTLSGRPISRREVL